MNYVHLIQNAVPKIFCDMICLVSTVAEIHGLDRHVALDYRQCRILDIPTPEIPGSGELCQMFRDHLRKAVDFYKLETQSPTLNFTTLFEKPQIMRYEPAHNDHFHEHADAWNVDSATRALSSILFCNDVAEGGETEFPGLGLSFRPMKGSMLLFPSSFTHSHLAKTPKSGPKIVVVTWLHFNGDGVRYATLPLL